jgi:serine/threonine protein kinase
MTITDPLVLPADVVLVPIAELPEGMRSQFEYDDGDYAITRPRARTPSKVIDSGTASLLRQFQSPKTIVDAIIGYSQDADVDPKETLDSAYPLIRYLIQSALLVSADSEDAKRITQILEFGDWVAGYQVVYCIQVLEDTELYQVKRPGESHAVLKILRPTAHQAVGQTLTRESAILRLLDGVISPVLYETGTHESRPYLIMSWCGGVDAVTAAAEFREAGDTENRQKLLELCATILEAYNHLHHQHVIHGDIHPRNLIISSDETVKIVDYGLARYDDPDSDLNCSGRGGVGFFFEPEYAQAVLAHCPPPQSSTLGEQYALAALLYHLLTSTHYVDFSLEREAMFRQIVEEHPLPFSNWDAISAPEVERIIMKALSKTPEDRFSSVDEFARAFRQAVFHDSEIHASARSHPQIHKSSVMDKLLQNTFLELAPDGDLFTSGLPVAPTCSIMAGAAGIAYALYRIACARQSAQLFAWADLWSVKAHRDSVNEDAFTGEELEATPKTVGEVSPYHTISGLHAVQALISHAAGDPLMQQTAVETFVRASQAPCDSLDLTLGRSSTLLACSLLLDTISGNEGPDPASLRDLGDAVMRGIWEEINTYPPIVEAKALTNLGIAHGWAGILYATIRWHRSSGSDLPAQAEVRLEQLAELAEPIGRGVRWKWMLERPSPDAPYPYMPGWCNGSAGYVHLWTLAHYSFHNDTYLRLAEMAAWHAWEHPQNIDSLCCGLAGRAYALLNLYKHTDETVWLNRARVLAERAVIADPTPDLPAYSLYKGKVGVAVLLADLENPDTSAMPFFEEEGWPVVMH